MTYFRRYYKATISRGIMFSQLACKMAISPFKQQPPKQLPSKEGSFKKAIKFIYSRAVVSGGAWGTLAPPKFGSNVNPMPTGGGRLCPPHYC